MSAPRVAIVSDALVQRGGAERVVEALAETFPGAPVFALLYSPESGPASLRSRVVTSPLNALPFATTRHRWLFPLYAAAIESFELGAYDVIVSSHHSVGKNILRSANQFHLCYCHTPMRALWERSVESRTVPSLAKPLADLVFRNMRVWDYAGASRVDAFVANGRTTQRRIRAHYGRDSTIISPPIETERFVTRAVEREDFYLVASRLIPYKRVDLAIGATAVAGRKLVIVGAGPDRTGLDAPHVEYRGHVTDPELIDLMQRARGMIFPAFEDFGMAPVEMMACGGPIVAYGRGGARETVVDGVTGVFADEQSVSAFAAAIERFEALEFDPAEIRAHAEQYSRARFAERIRALVSEGHEARVD